MVFRSLNPHSTGCKCGRFPCSADFRLNLATERPRTSAQWHCSERGGFQSLCQNQNLEMKILQLGLAVALASGIAAIIVYIIGASNFYGGARVSNEELSALVSSQSGFMKCVNANGLGLGYWWGRSLSDFNQVPKRHNFKVGRSQDWRT